MHQPTTRNDPKKAAAIRALLGVGLHRPGSLVTFEGVPEAADLFNVEALAIILVAVDAVLLVVNNPVLVVRPWLGRRRMQSLSRFPAHTKRKRTPLSRDDKSRLKNKLLSKTVLAPCLVHFDFDSAVVTCRQDYN